MKRARPLSTPPSVRSFHLFMATQFREVGEHEEGIEVNELTFSEFKRLLYRNELVEQLTVYRALRDFLRQKGV